MKIEENVNYIKSIKDYLNQFINDRGGRVRITYYDPKCDYEKEKMWSKEVEVKEVITYVVSESFIDVKHFNYDNPEYNTAKHSLSNMPVAEIGIVCIDKSGELIKLMKFSYRDILDDDFRNMLWYVINDNTFTVKNGIYRIPAIDTLTIRPL